MSNIIHHGKATSFADPKDIIRFQQCKDQGHTDKYCFKFGDNGIGYWGDKTTEGTGPCCALIPEDIREEFKSLKEGHLKKIEVTIGEKQVICLVKDIMPPRSIVKHGAIIDLNPDAYKALGQKAPLMEQCSWRVVD